MVISKLTAKLLNGLFDGDFVSIDYKKQKYKITKRDNLMTPFQVYDYKLHQNYNAQNLADIKFYITDLI